MSLKNNRKVEAPDGGWGYLVCVAITINMVALTAFQPCFGMIYKDFMVETNMGTTSLTFLNGVTAITSSLTSFFMGALLKVVSLRKLTLTASILFNAGVFIQVWMKTQWELFIGQGVLIGLGMGMLYTLSFTLLNDYFVKKRLLANSLSQTATAVMAIVSPMFTKWALEEFGFKGMLMLQSGISLHTFVATALMQPAKWHMKPVLDDHEEIKPLTELSADTNKEDVHNIKEIEQNIVGTGQKSKDSLKYVFDLGLNEKQETLQAKKSLMDKVSEVLDLSLFKDVHIMTTCIAMSTSLFIEVNYILMLPQSLYEMKWDEGTVALALTLYGIGDLIARILLIIFNKLASKFSSRSIFIASIIMSVVSRVGMLLLPGTVTKLCFIMLMGIFRCPIVTLGPLVTSDCVDQKRFASAMGLFLLMLGIISLSCGPLIGLIRDLFDSYTLTFYILNGLFVAVVVIWCTETYFFNKKQRILIITNKKQEQT